MNARISRGRDVDLGWQWTVENMRGVSNEVISIHR